MKRGAPLKRTAFKRKTHEPTVSREDRAMARAERIARQTPPPTLHKATTAKPAFIAAVPKTQAKRNQALLDMAEGRECLLCVPGVCNGDRTTVVACHSNFAEHGKAKNRKADDQYSVWGCAACHRWLDQPIGAHGPAKEQKRTQFMLAHADQVIEWSRVMNDPSEPERFRKAARWALEQLNSTLLDAVDAAERATI